MERAVLKGEADAGDGGSDGGGEEVDCMAVAARVSWEAKEEQELLVGSP